MENSAGAPTGADYYRLNHQRFMGSFLETADKALGYLSERYGDDVAQKICDDARREFEKLLPELPYLGGDEGEGTKWIFIAGCTISFFRPMKARDYTAKETGRMMYDLYMEQLNATPEDDLKRQGAIRFTKEYIEGTKAWADSPTKRFEKDFVASFVPGDGDSFDYGLDFHYCPCVEYFKDQDAGELAPYFCLLDFPDSQRMGTGLIRTKTLAQGDDICNFRHKKDRQVLQDWSTEVPKID
ncbi:MAG: L-2-amino-thiazoline-4-carboxylic acid hydrolase [Proteobacteria bacterium]|nr:L-2-amino-thiazoline-4-carboxylic acid hydrolase [Pseudomonadota bacterium]